LKGRYRQADLADLLGVTTRSVITVLNTWRQRTFIDYDTATGILTVLDPARLRELAHRQAGWPGISADENSLPKRQQVNRL